MNNNKKQKNNLVNKVLKEIDKKEINPKPEWYFSVKEKSVWIAGILSILIGAVSVSAIIFSLVNTRWSERVLTHNSGITMLAETLPYFWILTIIIFVSLAYQGIKHTKKGYKWPLLAITSWIILASIVMGLALFVTGAGAAADRFAGRLPIHKDIEKIIMDNWNNLEDGLLAGEIIEITNATATIKTLGGNKTVYLSIKDTNKTEREILSIGSKVRFIGFSINEESFYVCRVLPWEKMQKPKLVRQEKISVAERNKNERKLETERNNNCEDIRPYRVLKRMN